MSGLASFPYTAADLDRFRQAQRLAYDIALRVEAQLQVGMTEAEVCTLIAAGQAEHDVIQVFHQPLAWFGHRTVLGADWVAEALAAEGTGDRDAAASTPFFPTHESLAAGMPLIMDLAPVQRGYASDIGYACVLRGPNPVFDELDEGLAHMRAFLLEGVRAGETLRSLYRTLDALIDAHGWENCHQHYPDRALGHIVFPLAHDPYGPSPIPGFGPAAAEALLAARRTALEQGTGYPVWNDRAPADHPASPGVWSVEPHIGRDGVGVKFEELLVVTGDDAYWLDDHLPHTDRWAVAGYSTEPYRPR